MASSRAGGATDEREARFEKLLNPIRDLALNWNIDVAHDLEEYLEELEHIEISFDGGLTSLNFAEAARVIQVRHSSLAGGRPFRAVSRRRSSAHGGRQPTTLQQRHGSRVCSNLSRRSTFSSPSPLSTVFYAALAPPPLPSIATGLSGHLQPQG